MKPRTETVGLAALAALVMPAVGISETITIMLPQDVEIEMALDAAPEHLRNDATVYVFEEKGYRKVRSGGNGFVCMVNRDGNQHGDNDIKPTCWDPEGSRTIVPVMLRVGELIAESATAEEIAKDIDSGFASGEFTPPQKAGIAYMLKGDIGFDPETQQITDLLFPPHYMIYSPGVSSADIGMDVENATSDYALPSVYEGYSGGSHTAYIIVLAAKSAEHGH